MLYHGYLGHESLSEYTPKACATLPLIPLVPENLNLLELLIYLMVNVYATVFLDNAAATGMDSDYAYHVLDNKHGEHLYAWPASTPVERVLDDLTANGWKCSVHGDVIECIHTDLQKTLFKLVLESPRNVVEVLLDHEPPYKGKEQTEPKFPGSEVGYIRFGDLPKDGHSFNMEMGIPEFGVSAFDAEITKEGNYGFVRVTPAISRSAAMFLDAQLPAYRLYGEVVGYGSDGSPLLKVSKAEALSGRCLGAW